MSATEHDGERWLSGRASDSGARGWVFETYLRDKGACWFWRLFILQSRYLEYIPHKSELLLVRSLNIAL